MRFSFVPLCILICAGAALNTASAETGRSGWYFSIGTGLALSSGMDQEGWNRDTVCYPTDPCFVADPVPALSGYRWGYAIDADAGTEFEITFGRALSPLRLEVSASQSKNNIEQEFVFLEYLDGSPWIGREGLVSNDVDSIGDLITRIVTLNVYRDFSAAHRSLTPYIGVGLGAAFVKVSDVQYENDYQDTTASPPSYDPPLSFYNSVQDDDYSDTVAAGRLHAGADYNLNDRMQLGAKLTYTLVNDIADTGVYDSHPMQQAGDPPFINHTTFTAAHSWSLAVTLKHQFGH